MKVDFCVSQYVRNCLYNVFYATTKKWLKTKDFRPQIFKKCSRLQKIKVSAYILNIKNIENALLSNIDIGLMYGNEIHDTFGKLWSWKWKFGRLGDFDNQTFRLQKIYLTRMAEILSRKSSKTENFDAINFSQSDQKCIWLEMLYEYPGMSYFMCLL